MKESSTYQGLIAQGLERGIEKGIEQGIEQGLERGVRTTILRQGTKRFGAVPPNAAAVLEGVHDFEALETIAERILDASSWDDLIAGAPTNAGASETE